MPRFATQMIEIAIVIVVATDPSVGEALVNVQVMYREVSVGGQEAEKMRRVAKELIKTISGVGSIPSHFKSCHHVWRYLQGQN